jgi:cell division septum initiation protein DivIVA
MEDEGLINLTNDEKAMFLDLVIEELNEEIKKMKVQRKNPNHLKNLLASKEKIKNECRKRLVIKYFEK